MGKKDYRRGEVSKSVVFSISWLSCAPFCTALSAWSLPSMSRISGVRLGFSTTHGIFAASWTGLDVVIRGHSGC